MNEDVVVGAFSGYKWNQIKYWVNSIHNSGFTGRKHVIIVGETDDNTKEELNKRGFLYACVPNVPNIPIHVSRFIWLWKLLDETSPVGNVFWSDVRDVVYQYNPSDAFNHDNVFYTASESLKYKDEPWGRDNFRHCFGDVFYEKFKNREIFNVGTFCGHPTLVRDIALLIFQMSLNRPIPIVDQAVFNMLLYQSPFDSVVINDRKWYAATLGTTMDPSKIDQFRPHLLDPEPVVRDDMVYDATGIPFLIVHQYDRVPGLKEKIEAKYGE